MKSVELFAGAGGLAMGASLAGFESQAIIEWDRWACDTMRENRDRQFPLVKDWPLHESDVRTFDLSSLPEDIDLIAGGPPCQPFSIGGKHRGSEDERDMFSAMVDIVEQLRPRALIVENVRGLTRPKFSNYFAYVLLRFEFPEIRMREGEKWTDHLARLERQKTSGGRSGLTYDIVHRVLNAADFGVPQRRERVFIVGFREDVGVKWSFADAPETYSLDALLSDQWVTGRYWERHRIPDGYRRPVPRHLSRRIQRLRRMSLTRTIDRQPWRTVRDALVDLPDPKNGFLTAPFFNHRYQAGARVYKGHIGSPLDLPAKTLKAGDHGVPGGENMMVMDSGKVRYFTVREAARLQTFPDGYVFHGSWTETMRQLGNAVPVVLAHRIAASVAEKLVEADIARLSSRETE